MYKTKKEKLLMIIALVVGIASLSVGFAAFSTTLNISSSASVNPNSDNFSVKFSTKQDSLDVGPVKAIMGFGQHIASDAVINNTQSPTLSNISVTFKEYGFVDYIVYARNEGEYTAYLNSLNYNGSIICTPVGATSEELVNKACDNLTLYMEIDGTVYDDSVDLENIPLERGAGMRICVRLSYGSGYLADGPFTVSFPEISLIYSTVNQSGYKPEIMGSTNEPGTLNSKIKADTLYKGTDANVDFRQTPETGVYVRSGTENHVNPIYYYRGEVDNNNVLFAGKCWKIVRTTETGGTKLIYNGTPTTENKCNGDNSMIGYSTFNDNYDSLEDVSYIYSDGTNSTIKQAVDTWYTSNMTSYTDMLEDTVWCNDRSVSRVSSVNGNENYTYFGSSERNGTYRQYQPSLHCPAEYSLTTSATQVTNKLTYPVGLLTADELTLAGMGESGYTESGYLNNYDYWWTMSPYYFGNGTAVVFGGFEDGDLGIDHVVNEFGVRPAVSLKPGAYVSIGNGTASSPYVIE